MCLSEVESGFNLIDRIKTFCVNRKDKIKKFEYPYYFENYTKHITIYKNGNGIIINSADLIVTNKNLFDKIYRKLNIEDGKKDSVFPSLENMLKTDKKDRFDKFGFWYYSENNIINNIEEFYWSDTDKTVEDKKIKENPKEIRWYFDFNTSKIEENKNYKIIYVISVEGLYPIENGTLIRDLINDPNSKDNNESSIEIQQAITNFRYIVSFEDGISLKKEPKCEIKENMYSSNITVADIQNYNVLFNKHNFTVSKPILGSQIKVSWQFLT